MKEAVEIIQEQEGFDRARLALELGLTVGMLSHYANHNHYPRLKVAAIVYRKYRLQVEPFTELALSDEIESQIVEEMS